jgi:hypothetical protein
MYVLRSLPNTIVRPMSFEPGSRRQVEAAVEGILRQYGGHGTTTRDYEEWLQNKAPLSDDANEHVLHRPLFVPFSEILFGAGARAPGGGTI